MQIVFMGTPDFALPSLQALIDSDYNVAVVVTQPDKPRNRGKVIFSPVKQLAVDNGINVLQPIKIRGNEEFYEELKQLKPDMIVVAAFGQILPVKVLELPKYGSFNVHGSLLPRWRGAAPMQYSIMEGDSVTGVTIMKMAAGLDTGDMISKVEASIDCKDIKQIEEELSVAGAKLLMKTIPEIISGTAVYEKQDENIATYAHMINKEDGLIDFNGSAVYEERKIRALGAKPGVFTYYDDKIIKFFNAEVLDKNENEETAVITEVCKDNFVVNFKKGKLKVKEVQLQGRKRMNAGDFLRGHKINVGDRFGKEED